MDNFYISYIYIYNFQMPLGYRPRINMFITNGPTYSYTPPPSSTNNGRFVGMGLGLGYSMIGRISNLKPGCGSCGK
jgi:hypothetical protein